MTIDPLLLDLADVPHDRVAGFAAARVAAHRAHMLAVYGVSVIQEEAEGYGIGLGHFGGRGTRYTLARDGSSCSFISPYGFLRFALGDVVAACALVLDAGLRHEAWCELYPAFPADDHARSTFEATRRLTDELVAFFGMKDVRRLRRDPAYAPRTYRRRYGGAGDGPTPLPQAPPAEGTSTLRIPIHPALREAAREEITVLDGVPPHDGPGNYLAGCPDYAQAIAARYGVTLCVLRAELETRG